MFGWDDEEKRWAAIHHPFTAPRDEDLAKLESDPGKVQAKAYDLVLNGYEVGGGSIRIHRQDVQVARVQDARHGRSRKPRPASASCSTRCRAVPRRTAASPSASTAGA